MKLSLLVAGLAATSASALRIAASLQWIEHTPIPYAIKNFYNGTSAATLMSGGVQSIASVDLAANAETQGLLTLGSQQNLKLIYVVCEVVYRLVANKASGISTMADLKGKKIGTEPGTSAGYFIYKMLNTVGLGASDYRVVSGNVCMKAPCGAGTFPAMIKSGAVDAFGIWEPAPQLAIDAMGTEAVVFQNYSVYREVYSLYTTADKLASASTKADIVNFVRALNETLTAFNKPTDAIYSFVAQNVGMDESVVKEVWPVHKWSGIWGSDLLDFLVEEDAWLAQQNRRQATPQATLESFLDPSIWESI